jgi:hypothetical protein
MGNIGTEPQVKLFTGLIFSSTQNIENIYEKLIEKWGGIEHKSEIIPFDYTDYYSVEMGKNLMRQWVSFKNEINAGALADIKAVSNDIEQKFTVSEKRQINIDPGYITLANVILASTKDFSHRIYLRKGIYAEITLIYKGKEFIFLPWTYPDYKSKTAIDFFKNIRQDFHSKMKNK